MEKTGGSSSGRYPGHAGYFQRTYLAGGRPYAHVYRASRYRGIVYVRYVPAYYYQPRFYGWVSNPWRTPVVYNWGGLRRPGWDSTRGYFTPAPCLSDGGALVDRFRAGGKPPSRLPKPPGIRTNPGGHAALPRNQSGNRDAEP